MSSTQQPDATPDGVDPTLSLNVSFAFDRQWSMGPDGRLSKFPPGAGNGARTVEIGPVQLHGLSAAQIAAIVAKRTDDMALVATAVAVATRQLAAALEAVGQP